jgi:hypothetical protein
MGESMRDLMIDLETMGTGHNSAILSIGAVAFDPMEGTRANTTFYAVLNLKSCTDLGLKIDADTLMWWMKQSEQARDDWVNPGDDPVNLEDALFSFESYMANTLDCVPRNALVWANAPSFDCGLMADAYAACSRALPWKYYNERCFRTVKSLAKVSAFPFVGRKHNALDDALHQAKCVCKYYKAIGLAEGDPDDDED